MKLIVIAVKVVGMIPAAFRRLCVETPKSAWTVKP